MTRINHKKYNHLIFRIINGLCIPLCFIVFPIIAVGFSVKNDCVYVQKTEISFCPKDCSFSESFTNSHKNEKTSCVCSLRTKISDLYKLQNDTVFESSSHHFLKKKGPLPWIAPASLIAAGSVIHFMPDVKQGYRDFIRSNLPYSGQLDDYTPYLPLALTLGFNIAGHKGKNNPGNLSAIAVKSFLLNGLITDRLKYITQVQRPNGELRSFPSGHTSKAFAMAHIMHHEFGELSFWYSAGAYACASATAILRTSKDAHWISDVLAGAGIGILSTELIYRTHHYKWDNDHLKRLDIFPFRLGNQKGLSMIYRF